MRAITVVMSLVGLLWASDAATAGWPDLDATPPVTGGGELDAGVVVAVQDYSFMTGVPGAWETAAAWFRWLNHTRRIPAHRMRVLRDLEVTADAMRQVVRDSASLVRPGGTLWFVFIGQGATSRRGQAAILLGADAHPRGVLRQRGMSLDELQQAVAAGRQRHVIAVIDASFDGRDRRGVPVLPVSQKLGPLAVGASNFTLLLAAKERQYAGRLPGADHPAYSYLLLGALRGWGDEDGNGNVSLGEAHRYARGAMGAVIRGRYQSPQLLGPGAAEVVSVRAREPAPNLGELMLEARQEASSAGHGKLRVVAPLRDVYCRVGEVGPERPAPFEVEVPAGTWEVVCRRGRTRIARSLVEVRTGERLTANFGGSGDAATVGAGAQRGRWAKLHKPEGVLRVNARPWARCTVDGGPAQVTPFLMQLPRGDHKVSCRYRGKRITRNICVTSADQRTLLLEMLEPDEDEPEETDTGRADVGRLRLNARPWARCTVDGGPGRLTPVSLDLRPGMHRITCARAGQQKSRTVRIRAGKATTVVMTLH